MNKKIAMVIAHNGFRDEEYWVTKEIIEEAGMAVTTVSSQLSPARSKFGKTAEVDAILTDIQASDFDALVFIGGPGTQEYFHHPQAQQMAWDFFKQNKTVAAICAAPVILAYAGLLHGKKATVFPADKDILEKNHVSYTGRLVEKDGKIITGSGPEAASAFAQEIVGSI